MTRTRLIIQQREHCLNLRHTVKSKYTIQKKIAKRGPIVITAQLLVIHELCYNMSDSEEESRNKAFIKVLFQSLFLKNILAYYPEMPH